MGREPGVRGRFASCPGFSGRLASRGRDDRSGSSTGRPLSTFRGEMSEIVAAASPTVAIFPGLNSEVERRDET